MFHTYGPSNFVRRSLALTAVLGASVAVAAAQTTPASTAPDQSSVSAASNAPAAPALNLQLPAVDTSRDSLFSSSASSSSDDAQVASNTGHINFVEAMQYGGRRRYGRPRYRGGNTNPDGSNKWAFVAGGGFTNPFYDTGVWNNLSWSAKVGVGRNFNKMFGILAEYNYDNFGLTGGNLNHQARLYDSYGYVDQNGSPIDFSSLDGNAHAWSLTLNPIIHLTDTDTFGVYVVGGGGFYRKLTNFTLPQTVVGCDPYYGYCGYYTANQTIDHYSNNAGGLNGGMGFTYKFSRFSGEKFFAEARYTWIANSQSQNSVGGQYPQNNFRTTYVPVTVGLRW